MQLLDLLGSSIFYLTLFFFEAKFVPHEYLKPKVLALSSALWLLKLWRPYVLPRKIDTGW